MITFPMVSPLLLVNIIYTIIDFFTKMGNDLVILMDRSNQRLLTRIVPEWEDTPAGAEVEGCGIEGKVHLMMEFAGASEGSYFAVHNNARDVADPWYTGDFEQTYQDVLAGCSGLLKLLSK